MMMKAGSIGLLFLCGWLFDVAEALGSWTYKTTPPTCTGTPGSPCGVPYWAQVPGAATCGSNSQSPIDLSNVKIRNNLTLPSYNVINNGCSTWVQFSNNYTFEVAFVDPGHTCTNLQLTYKQDLFVMQQIHFHAPSEHTFGGGYYSAEAHFVHKSTTTGQLLVLGVPFQVSASNLRESNNTFLQTLWNAGGPNTRLGEETVVTSSVPLNPYSTLLPGRKGTYRYSGSLTVPPCSENVQWFVFDEPVPISQNDLSILRQAMGALPTTIVSESGNNNRATCALNNRLVYYTSGEVTANQATTTSSSDDENNRLDAAESTSIAAIVIASVALLASLVSLVWLSHLQQVLLGPIGNKNKEGHGLLMTPRHGNDENALPRGGGNTSI